MHTYYCASTDLFQRVILMSGSSLAPWALVRSPMAHVIAVAEALQCDSSSGDAAKKCLKDTPVEELMNVRVQVSVLRHESIKHHW